MKLFMIIFISFLSYCKSISIIRPNSASDLPLIGKYFETSSNKPTDENTPQGTSNSLTPSPSTVPLPPRLSSTESSKTSDDSLLPSNKEMKTSIANDILRIISEHFNKSNKTVEDGVNSFTDSDHSEEINDPKSTLQYFWNKIKNLGRRAGRSIGNALSSIGNKLKQVSDYMSRGHEMVDSLHEAAETANEATKDSQKHAVQILNSFIALCKHIMEVLRSLFKTDPREIELERQAFNLRE